MNIEMQINQDDKNSRLKRRRSKNFTQSYFSILWILF